MKKLLALFLATVLTLSLTACGSNNDGNAEQGQDQVTIASSLELLNTVWDSYGDEEKFPAAGGDMSEENMATDAPGIYGIEDAGALDSMLGFPAASVEKIDDAASLVHMLNANTFTCGAYHVKNTEDVTELAAALEDNIMQRQWMCGFPEKLVIAVIGNYVVAFFGHTEPVDTFQTKLSAAYTSTEIICDKPIG